MPAAPTSAIPAAAQDAQSRGLFTDDGRRICERCVLADSIPTRMRGLLGRRELPAGEGLLIRPTNAVHMFFMRFPIDAVFLDGEGTVLRIAADLQPWRMAAQRGARSVLELRAGTCAARGLRAGERLDLTRNAAGS